MKKNILTRTGDSIKDIGTDPGLYEVAIFLGKKLLRIACEDKNILIKDARNVLNRHIKVGKEKYNLLEEDARNALNDLNNQLANLKRNK